MSWNDDRVETLKRMWAEGASASQIAKELGQVTRNAVIGKVHRLGLSNRVGPGGRPEDEAAEAPEAEALAPRMAPEPEPEEEDEPSSEPKALEEDDEPEEEPEAPIPFRRQIIPAGQPLPPSLRPTRSAPRRRPPRLPWSSRRVGLSLMELTEKTCKWPVGDPATPNFWFAACPYSRASPTARPMWAWPSSP
jgi:GcrA cell cycle regulator